MVGVLLLRAERWVAFASRVSLLLGSIYHLSQDAYHVTKLGKRRLQPISVRAGSTAWKGSTRVSINIPLVLDHRRPLRPGGLPGTAIDKDAHHLRGRGRNGMAHSTYNPATRCIEETRDTSE
jgi:hypothetical protein